MLDCAHQKIHLLVGLNSSETQMLSNRIYLL